MGQSVLVFVSHSSEDKESYIKPIVSDLEECYINVWIDNRKIVPGDNLRKSIFRDGLDKADIALLFFTEKSLESSWVDREIKHVLREESKKGNNFDLNKIISIFDSEKTYEEIGKRYPELTDDLLHLIPEDYDKIHIGQLITAIWSKYLSLQGGDVATQRQLLEKEKELFQKDKDIQALKDKIKDTASKNPQINLIEEFESYIKSGKIDGFVSAKNSVLGNAYVEAESTPNIHEAMAFGLVDFNPKNKAYLEVTQKGKDFFKWIIVGNS